MGCSPCGNSCKDRGSSRTKDPIPTKTRCRPKAGATKHLPTNKGSRSCNNRRGHNSGMRPYLGDNSDRGNAATLHRNPRNTPLHSLRRCRRVYRIRSKLARRTHHTRTQARGRRARTFGAECNNQRAKNLWRKGRALKDGVSWQAPGGLFRAL